jgi:acyl carrier protein
MDEFLNEMAEILEEELVNPNDILQEFESWDSLASLSVAALADSSFGINLSSQEINAAVTIQDLYERILAKRAT